MGTFYIPERAMAIVAHPDDIDYSCSGTLARWADSGTKISYVLCTSGDVGIADPGMTKALAAEIREREQLAAAEIIGAEEVVFLREPDGMLVPTLDLRKRLVREIRRYKPEVVLTGDPTIVWAGDDYINHPDHRAAAAAALDAVFPAAGQPNLFEELEDEGLKAHKPRKVYVENWGPGNVVINIDSTVDRKIKALRAHQSQMIDHDPEPMVRQWAAETAKGLEFQYGESFRVVTLVTDEEWEKRKNGSGN